MSVSSCLKEFVSFHLFRKNFRHVDNIDMTVNDAEGVDNINMTVNQIELMVGSEYYPTYGRIKIFKARFEVTPGLISASYY